LLTELPGTAIAAAPKQAQIPKPIAKDRFSHRRPVLPIFHASVHQNAPIYTQSPGNDTILGDFPVAYGFAAL
jgi:hypothetical protein